MHRLFTIKGRLINPTIHNKRSRSADFGRQDIVPDGRLAMIPNQIAVGEDCPELGAESGIGTAKAVLPAAAVAVKRLLIGLLLSVLASACSLPVGRDVQAYNTCLSRHPHDTVVCEGPRQAYELDPSIAQLRSVAGRPAAGYGY